MENTIDPLEGRGVRETSEDAGGEGDGGGGVVSSGETTSSPFVSSSNFFKTVESEMG